MALKNDVGTKDKGMGIKVFNQYNTTLITRDGGSPSLTSTKKR
jgi:hypothetical protein